MTQYNLSDILNKNFSGEFDRETTLDEVCKWFEGRTREQIYKEFTYHNNDDTTVTINSPYTWAWDYDRGVYRANVSNVHKALRLKNSENYDNTSKELDDFLSEFKVKEAVSNG